MIEARYEHYQPETHILLGHVELHKIFYSLGQHTNCSYNVNYTEREEPNQDAVTITESFNDRVAAVAKFKEYLEKFNAKLV